jgi:hypothetical protein
MERQLILVRNQRRVKWQISDIKKDKRKSIRKRWTEERKGKEKIERTKEPQNKIPFISPFHPSPFLFFLTLLVSPFSCEPVLSPPYIKTS